MKSLFEIDSLSHRYGSVLALDGVSISVEQGAIGLVGQNGAGKSTLIKILLGLVRHTGGTVSVFGSDVAKHGVGLRGRIGYMPEREGVTPPGGHACSRDFVFALLRQSPQAPQACSAYRKLTGASAVETSLELRVELLGGVVYNVKIRAKRGGLTSPRAARTRLQTILAATR